jgi:universal protein Kae1
VKTKICLGIESTAHTFGVGVADSSGKILAERRDMFRPKTGSGFVPSELADHHVSVAERILKMSLKDARVSMDDVDVVSFSAGPGIPNSLRVGAAMARFLAAKFRTKLVPVNHAISHIEIGKLTTKCKDPIVVYLSGGNSQIIAHSENFYRVFGETQDIPVGNAFDVFAREIGLPTPGGPDIERLAKRGKFVDLPYVVKGMDFSFSGLLTHVGKKYESGASKEDLCYSMQETCFSMLTEVTERALAHNEKEEVLLVGGVAANERLQRMMRTMCEDRAAKFHVVPQKFAGDQGAMIAWTGLVADALKLEFSKKDFGMNQNWRVDQVYWPLEKLRKPRSARSR